MIKKRLCLLHDCPDNASAMKRRQAKLEKDLQDLPGALVHTMGCCAHKVHRIVVTSTDEPKFLGDVYAVAFSASIPGHRSTIHRALWDWIDTTLQISHVPPDPAWQVHKRAILSHTLRRRVDHVRGPLLDGEALFVGQADPDETHDALMQYVNGDTREPVLMHHELGCCSSVAETKENMFAAILNAGLVLGSDTDLPRADKWGSATRSLGMACGSLMFHGVLREVVVRAFPTWDAGLPPDAANAGDGDDGDEYRAMCRSKVWRMGKVLRDIKKEVEWAIISWTAEPLDHLWQRLQYLDARGNVLVSCTGSSSPFKECSRALLCMVVTPTSTSSLSPLFWQYHRVETLSTRVRSRVLCMAAQVWWRFLEFDHYPLKLARLVDACNNDKPQSARDFWDTHDCCKSKSFCCNVKELCVGPEHMLSDEACWFLLQTWSRAAKLTNMHIERRLAEIKRGVAPTTSTQRPSLERLASSGVLCQWLSAHIAAGGDDPRFLHRKTLVANGAPLSCAVHLRDRAHRPAGPFFLFRREAIQRRLEQVGGISRLESREEQRRLGEVWRTMSEAEKAPYYERSRADFHHGDLARISQDVDVENPTHSLQPKLWQLNSREAPLALNTFERVAREACDAQQLPGSRIYCSKLREGFCRGLFVRDQGA